MMNMRKVTVGFKCNPDLKLELMNESHESEMTVSEYLEALIENRNMGGDMELLKYQIRQLREELDKVLNRLNIYEVKMLGPVYEKHKGQAMDYRLPNGKISKRLISSPMDMLIVIISALDNQP